MSNPLLRTKLDNGEFFYAPGIQDMITAVIAKEPALDVVYASGYWLTASAMGLPDAGIASFTQMLDRVETLARSVGAQPGGAAVIANADTGYGGLLNVHHTVRLREGGRDRHPARGSGISREMQPYAVQAHRADQHNGSEDQSCPRRAPRPG